MLLTRKVGEGIDFTLEDGQRITMRIEELDRNRANIRIEAPRSIRVDRCEVTAAREKGAERGPERQD